MKSLRAETQSDYALRKTNNYFDLIEGRNYHATPLTFHEFLSKPESLFLYEDSFFQVPGYVQAGAELRPIEESARQYVVQAIVDEFEEKLLGMQDYVHWAKLFKNRCDSLCVAFWAQVNMLNLMFAKDLEMDDNEYERDSTGSANRTGSGSTTSTGSSTTEGSSNTKTTQDIENTQLTDSSTREANATVVRAEDQLTQELTYNWADAADNTHEIRSRSGDTHQHMESVAEGTSSSTTDSTSTQTQNENAQNDTTQSHSTERQSVTNKMFMQERGWAVETARQLLPLDWLFAALRPMFYLIY